MEERRELEDREDAPPHAVDELLALAAPLERGDRRRQTPVARGALDGARDLIGDESQELFFKEAAEPLLDKLRTASR